MVESSGPGIRSQLTWRNGNKANKTAKVRALACNRINFRALCFAEHDCCCCLFLGGGVFRGRVPSRDEGIFQFLTLTRAHSNFSLFAVFCAHLELAKSWANKPCIFPANLDRITSGDPEPRPFHATNNERGGDPFPFR